MPLLADELPLITEEVWSINSFFRSREPLIFETQLGPLAIHLKAPGTAMRWNGDWAQIGFSCAGREGIVWFPYDLVMEMLQMRFPDLEIAHLDEDQSLLLSELVLGSALDQLGTHISTPLHLTSLTKGKPLTHLLSLEVTLPQGMICPAFLQVHKVDEERIGEAFRSSPLAKRPFTGLKTTICFRCGYTRLPVSELAGLEVGAGIVLDGTTLSFQKIIAVIGERFAQGCTWQTVKPVLDGPILNRAAGDLAFYTLGGFLNEFSDSEIGTASVNDVPIHLVFELGRTDVPLEELETLIAGYTFDLGKPLSQVVDILANGKRIASGDLVRIGEGIGVRVTRVIR